MDDREPAHNNIKFDTIDGAVEENMETIATNMMAEKRTSIKMLTHKIKCCIGFRIAASTCVYLLQAALVIMGVVTVSVGELDGLNNGDGIRLIGAINLGVGSLLAALTRSTGWLKVREEKLGLKRKEELEAYFKLVNSYDEAMEDGKLTQQEVQDVIALF